MSDDSIVQECESSNGIYANAYYTKWIKSLSDNEMISDVVINVTQKMMARWHPWLKSLEDPIVG